MRRAIWRNVHGHTDTLTHSHTHTNKPPTAGVQLVGHASINEILIVWSSLTLISQVRPSPLQVPPRRQFSAGHTARHQRASSTPRSRVRSRSLARSINRSGVYQNSHRRASLVNSVLSINLSRTTSTKTPLRHINLRRIMIWTHWSVSHSLRFTQWSDKRVPITKAMWAHNVPMVLLFCRAVLIYSVHCKRLMMKHSRFVPRHR